MKKYIILFLLFVSISSYSQINNWINNDINYSFEDKEQVFKDPNSKDTIYYDPSNPPQVFKGGVVYLEMQSYLFRSGSFDFVNNLWLDESGNGYDAELVDGNCVDINADVTITPTVALTDKTVVSVNDNADFEGVAVSGANLVIDFSELTDTLLYNIKLSDGQEFRLTTGVSKYVFAAANIGSLGGTENTEWEWAKTNSYHGNLQHGFTKAIYVNNTSNQLFGTTSGINFIYPQDSISIEWEGRPMEDDAALFGYSVVGHTYGYVFTYSKISNAIVFRTRVNGWVSIADTVEDGIIDNYFKLLVTYNGRGYDNINNFKFFINDNELSISTIANSTTDRNGVYWSGNSRSDHPEEFITKFIISINGEKIKLIEDGNIYFANTWAKPTLLANIPAFNSVDAFGETPTNIAYTNAFNQSETKIKFPFTSAIFNTDDYNYLFNADSTSKTIDVDNLYPEIGLLRCDNSDPKKVTNITYLPSERTTWSTLNGYKPYVPLVSLRFDGSGPDDTQLTHLDDYLTNYPYVKMDLHNTYHWQNDSYNDYIDNGQLALGLHSFPPYFWIYADSMEGYKAYTSATITQQGNGTVTEDQGQIGAYYGNVNYSAISDAENIHSAYGYEYPAGEPDSADNNSEYWSWALGSMKNRFIGLTPNAKFYSLTTLGAFPTGINYWHHNLIPMLIDSLDWSDYYPIWSDSLDLSKAKGANLSVEVSNDSSYLKLQGGAGSSYLSYFNDTLFKYPYTKTEFQIKQVGGVDDVKIALMRQDAYITISGATIKFNNVNYTNVMTGNDIYKVVLLNYHSYQEMIVYRNDSCLLYTAPVYRSHGSKNRFYINVTGDSCYLYGIKFSGINEVFTSQFYKMEHGFKLDDGRAPYSESEKLDTLKRSIINSVMKNAAPVSAVFSHYIIDPEVKADEETAQGTLDRSYNILSSFAQWANTNGFQFANSKDIMDGTPNSYRENYVRNGDFADSLYGETGKIWGYPMLTKDATYTDSLSIDGSNVCKLANTATISKTMRIKSNGLHWLKFYGEGTFIIRFYDNRVFNNAQEGTITLTNFEATRIPFHVDNYKTPMLVNITASDGDCYIHKLVIE